MNRWGLTRTAANDSAENRNARGAEDRQVEEARMSTTMELTTYRARTTDDEGTNSDQNARKECIWKGARLSSTLLIQREGCVSKEKYDCITAAPKWRRARTSCVATETSNPANMRQPPPTRRTSGIATRNCGLMRSIPKAIPASHGRPARRARNAAVKDTRSRTEICPRTKKCNS